MGVSGTATSWWAGVGERRRVARVIVWIVTGECTWGSRVEIFSFIGGGGCELLFYFVHFVPICLDIDRHRHPATWYTGIDSTTATSGRNTVAPMAADASTLIDRRAGMWWGPPELAWGGGRSIIWAIGGGVGGGIPYDVGWILETERLGLDRTWVGGGGGVEVLERLRELSL